jgi:carbohydrate-binding family V/XII|nr:MAG TPA: major capsid protein [Caudoviricetes sp.]
MPVEIKKTHVQDKHLGVIKEVLPYNAYSTPMILKDDSILLNGRTFTVLETNEAELRDYQRNTANELTTLQADETSYVLDVEKYWGLQIDDLDVKDLNTEVEKYQVAKQTNKIVAPYLDQLRFATVIANTSKNVIPVETKEYDAVLDAGAELDELATSGTRYLFVTPTFYKAIKKRIVELPQGDRDNNVRYKGVVGELDGAIVVKVPNRILNTGDNSVDAVLTVDNVLASPVQVDKFESGRLGAGRFGVYLQQLLYTGAFVLKKNQPKIITIAKKAPTAKKSGTKVAPKA